MARHIPLLSKKQPILPAVQSPTNPQTAKQIMEPVARLLETSMEASELAFGGKRRSAAMAETSAKMAIATLGVVEARPQRASPMSITAMLSGTDSSVDELFLPPRYGTLDVAAKRASFVESSGLPPARASFMSLLKGDCSLSLRDAVLHEGRPNIFSLIGEPPFLGDVVGLEEDDESSDEVEQQ